MSLGVPKGRADGLRRLLGLLLGWLPEILAHCRIVVGGTGHFWPRGVPSACILNLLENKKNSRHSETISILV